MFSRPAFPGQAVHRHGTEGSPGIRHQAEEGGEDEGDQRTGSSLSAVTCRTTFYSVLLPSVTSESHQVRANLLILLSAQKHADRKHELSLPHKVAQWSLQLQEYLFSLFC